MTVKQKQLLLACLDLLDPKDVDGVWGPQSIQATEKAQGLLDIEQDGDFGDQTADAIWQHMRSGDALEQDTPESSGMISEFFNREEFRCQCGGKYCNGFPAEPDAKLLQVLDEIRRRLGVPVYIVHRGGSGVRCARHNATVGGVANSEHLYGRAADLHADASPQKMYEVAQAVLGNTGGLGLYSWGIHVDVGKYSRWNG